MKCSFLNNKKKNTVSNVNIESEIYEEKHFRVVHKWKKHSSEIERFNFSNIKKKIVVVRTVADECIIHKIRSAIKSLILFLL